MAPALIYRIEHSDGHHGPWCDSDGDIHPLDARRMPTPWDDDLYDTRWLRSRIHGANLDRLFYWFTEDDRAKLHHAGFVLARYVVPPSKLAIGFEQVLFNPDFAERMGDETLV